MRDTPESREVARTNEIAYRNNAPKRREELRAKFKHQNSPEAREAERAVVIRGDVTTPEEREAIRKAKKILVGSQKRYRKVCV